MVYLSSVMWKDAERIRVQNLARKAQSEMGVVFLVESWREIRMRFPLSYSGGTGFLLDWRHSKNWIWKVGSGFLTRRILILGP